MFYLKKNVKDHVYLHLYCAIAQKEEQSAGKIGEKEKEEEK
jgi:hypothetical protein